MSAQKQNEYLLLFRGDAWYNKLSPEELQKAMNQFNTWFEQLAKKNMLKAAQPLGRSGTIVSGKQGRVVADGPLAESKEAIGGYFLLGVDSLEDAVAVAKACPGLEYGAQIEIRPVAEECPMAARAREILPEAQLATA